jgi:hypothetical protein
VLTSYRLVLQALAQVGRTAHGAARG